MSRSSLDARKGQRQLLLDRIQINLLDPRFQYLTRLKLDYSPRRDDDVRLRPVRITTHPRLALLNFKHPKIAQFDVSSFGQRIQNDVQCHLHILLDFALRNVFHTFENLQNDVALGKVVRHGELVYNVFCDEPPLSYFRTLGCVNLKAMQFTPAMSKNDEPSDPMEELKKNLDQAFKQGKVFFPMGGQFGPQSGAASTSEPSKEKPPKEEDTEREEALKRIHEFNLKPREIRDYLDRFVIQQREAKKVISVAICDHFNHVRKCLENPDLRERDYAKQNIILLGPTGVGKTYLMRNVAKLVGVPFVKADATKFSETGYVGGDVDDLVRDLVKQANGDVELAQYGIIYIDEIDKIAQKGDHGRDVSGRGVQINLLKLMEDTDVNLQSQTDLLGQMQAMMDFQQTGKARKKTINTRHILFIVSGAFDKLGESVRKRLTTTSMGFGASRNALDEESDDFLAKVETRDFIDYGFEPEFIGRLPVRVACQHLQPDDLLQILTSSEGSILAQYLSDFEGYEIKLNVSKDALRKVSEKAYKEKTGARGLMTVLERVFRDFKFELPSTGIKQFKVSESTVENPSEELKALLRENASEQRTVLSDEVNAYGQRFKEEYGFKLDFDEEAISALVDQSLEEDKTIRAICERKFRDFHHGLTLISRNTGQTVFPITESVIKNAEKELSDWVVRSYRDQQSEEQD